MNIVAPAIETDSQSDVLVDVREAPNWEVIVFNDDVNTFEHVIRQFMFYCKHTEEQAHQCAILIHGKGKCSVKEGSQQDMTRLAAQLGTEGIDARPFPMDDE